MVNTVLGPVAADKLGRTLIHEHLIYGFPGYQGDVTLGISRDEAMRISLAGIQKAKEEGVETILDATLNDIGRNPEFLKEVSERAEINVICTTGYYYEAAGESGYFNFRKMQGKDITEEIYELFMAEITSGIAKTGIKPGVIKVCSGNNNISDYDHAFFKAAGRAQKETGTVIITHAERGTLGPEQLELLVAEGAAPEKVMIGHISEINSMDDYIKVAGKGGFIAFDRFVEPCFMGAPSDLAQVESIKALIEKGYGDKVLMAHDAIVSMFGRRLEIGSTLVRISAEIIPLMREIGIAQADIDRIQIDNVNALFS
ncbi:MAG: phosphotriesterase-related protein [Clostridiales Family XIII bacterium]|nr:phosphotriesterase-related protein [Clostridiales Family XIII bacterium]